MRKPFHPNFIPRSYRRETWIFFFTALLVVGARLFSESTIHDNLWEEYRIRCLADSACQMAMQNDFDRCFDESWHLFSHRGLNMDIFQPCFKNASKQHEKARKHTPPTELPTH